MGEGTCKKPPLGVKPAWLSAWERVSKLAAAIQRQCNDAPHGNYRFCREWAREIVMQCDILEKIKDVKGGK